VDPALPPDRRAVRHGACDSLSTNPARAGNRQLNKGCSLCDSCLACCGLIPLSRAKESYGTAHGRRGELFKGPVRDKLIPGAHTIGVAAGPMILAVQACVGWIAGRRRAIAPAILEGMIRS
jgi:hypothetical protein